MANKSADLAKKVNVRAPKAEELEIESVSIEPAGNGFTVSVRKRLKKDKRDMRDCCISWPEPERSVFTDVASMQAHIGKIFGGEKSE